MLELVSRLKTSVVVVERATGELLRMILRIILKSSPVALSTTTTLVFSLDTSSSISRLPLIFSLSTSASSHTTFHSSSTTPFSSTSSPSSSATASSSSLTIIIISPHLVSTFLVSHVVSFFPGSITGFPCIQNSLAFKASIVSLVFFI